MCMLEKGMFPSCADAACTRACGRTRRRSQAWRTWWSWAQSQLAQVCGWSPGSAASGRTGQQESTGRSVTTGLPVHTACSRFGSAQCAGYWSGSAQRVADAGSHAEPFTHATHLGHTARVKWMLPLWMRTGPVEGQ